MKNKSNFSTPEFSVNFFCSENFANNFPLGNSLRKSAKNFFPKFLPQLSDTPKQPNVGSCPLHKQVNAEEFFK